MGAPLVLVVDDELGLLNLFADLVERLNYETIRANSGAVTLDILSQIEPDLLVLDIAMPGISGIDVLRYVQDTERLDYMKIIVLTALGIVPPMEYVEARVNLWLTRPIMPANFVEAVRSVVEDYG